jgi:hypothetical protein
LLLSIIHSRLCYHTLTLVCSFVPYLPFLTSALINAGDVSGQRDVTRDAAVVALVTLARQHSTRAVLRLMRAAVRVELRRADAATNANVLFRVSHMFLSSVLSSVLSQLFCLVRSFVEYSFSAAARRRTQTLCLE